MRTVRARSGPAAGTLLAGRYRLDAVLGRGGMATVYRAHDTATGSELALKLLGNQVAPDPEGQARFLREVEILRSLSHPAIPRFQGWGQSEAGPFLATDLVEGIDLHTEIRERGARPILRAAELVATVADALAAAHERGIVHADVKSPNVLLGRDGKVYLVDFGVAQSTGGPRSRSTASGDAAAALAPARKAGAEGTAPEARTEGATPEVQVLGTPEYMAPEQFAGGPIDVRTDVYSLGVVLHEVLTGRLPFGSDFEDEIARQHRTLAPPPPHLARPDTPPWLERVVLRCLQKDPALRFGAMRDVVDELRLRRDDLPRVDVLPGGDVATRDERCRGGFALTLECPRIREGWQPGMPLRLGEVLYRLDAVEPADGPGGRHRYRFSFWPETAAARGIVDYQRDTNLRRMERTRLSFAARLSEWLGRQ